MKHTSKTAKKTLETIRAAAMPAGYFKAERESDSGLMPLYAEMIDQRNTDGGHNLELWALGHTYVQAGDLMRDPEVVFLRVATADDSAQEWYPVEYRQDPYGIQVSAELDHNLMVKKYYPRRQRDLTSFVTTWCRNIEAQRGQEIRTAAA